MIIATKYERNIERLATLILLAFDRASDTYLQPSDDYIRTRSFYSNNDLNLYVNWYKLLEVHELNAIIITVNDIVFTQLAKADGKQEAKTEYDINICVKSENTNESINTILLALRILREKLLLIPEGYFECTDKDITSINIDTSGFSQGTDNVACGVLKFSVTTVEVLTDLESGLELSRGGVGRIADADIRFIGGKVITVKTRSSLSDIKKDDKNV